MGEDSSQIAVVWMTRMQNLSVVSACRTPTWECEETHSERAPEGLWLDAQPHPLFAPDGDSFLLLATVQEGDKEHFTHIKHVTLTQEKKIAVLSHGRYEVSRDCTFGRGDYRTVLPKNVSPPPLLRSRLILGERDLGVGHQGASGVLSGDEREETRPEASLRGARPHRGRTPSLRTDMHHVRSRRSSLA